MPMLRQARWFFLVVMGGLASGASARCGDIEGEPINYGKAPVNNAVSQLEQRLAAGKTTLTYEAGFGYLRDLDPIFTFLVLD